MSSLSSSNCNPPPVSSVDAVLTTGSVTRLIKGMRDGNELAATKLWELYFARIVRLARKHLGQTNRAVNDEEDVALSAFKSVFFCVERTASTSDFDRDAFWKIVATITMRKVYDAFTYERRQKRNPIKTPDGQRLALDHSDVEQFLHSAESSPELAMEIEEFFEQMLGKLPKIELRQIVALKLEGYTNQEIAARMNRGLSSIERKLKTIRQVWRDEFQV